MKYIYTFVLFAFVMGCVQHSFYIIDDSASEFNFEQDVYKTSKVKIPSSEYEAAEASEKLLIEIYGDEVVKECPWRITVKDDCYLVCGTLPDNMLGGVAQLKIRKSDGFTWVYYHGE